MTSPEKPHEPEEPGERPVSAITAVRLSGAADREEHPLLVLGPAEGHSAMEEWAEVAAGLTGAFDVLAWDLPGHGYNAPAPAGPPGAAGRPAHTVASLAAGLTRVVDDVLAQRGELGRPCWFAGVGLGGEVGAHLRTHAPDRAAAALVLDDVAVGERARLLRRQLLGEQDEDDAEAGRDGLDARSRALVALAVAVARYDDLAADRAAARGAGLTEREIELVVEQVEQAGRAGADAQR